MLDLDRLPQAIDHEGRISRRLFTAYLAALSAVPLLGRTTRAALQTNPSFSADPFALGVASGDPSPTGVVLWTRLCKDPAAPAGGLEPSALPVSWEVAEDEGMTRIVRSGKTVAAPELNHSVHIEVEGLFPDRWYFYRFRSGDAESPVARTRTLPASDATVPQLKLAFASCQHYEAGLYTAYKHMAQDDLDLIFHLGDYIYEGKHKKDALRTHSPTEAGGPLMTLTDYRLRHSQYRADKDLQAAHLRCPWWVTWDDHEVSNNYANDIDGTDIMRGAEFLKRRAAAYQAYYENMPLRARSLPKGPDAQMYRGASYGRLAELHILDTRQFRSNQPNGDGEKPLNAQALAETQTIMGSTQKAWLKQRLTANDTTWNLIANQVMMAMVRRHPAKHPDEDVYSMDQWPGYAHERMELGQFMLDHKVKNPVVITGDIHANYVNDLRVDDRKPETPIVASEFVGTSISSAGDGENTPAHMSELLSDNPCLHYHNRERGYVRATFTPTTCTADYLTVPYVTKPNAPLQKRASFTIEAGKPGIQKA